LLLERGQARLHPCAFLGNALTTHLEIRQVNYARLIGIDQALLFAPRATASAVTAIGCMR
jgi:hypothetical protein